MIFGVLGLIPVVIIFAVFLFMLYNYLMMNNTSNEIEKIYERRARRKERYPKLYGSNGEMLNGEEFKIACDKHYSQEFRNK